MFKISETRCGIFCTFETEAARQDHLNGEIPVALGAVAADLLAETPDIRPVDIVAAKDVAVGPESIHGVWIEMYVGPHDALRPLFEPAEDSAVQLDSYRGSGRVLAARSGEDVIGHLQLVELDLPSEVELKNMAVQESVQGRGIGAELVRAAIELVAAESRATLVEATAAADVGNLRFYQRLGFRMRSVERDAFVAATGYPSDIRIDAILLRDRVWLDYRL